MNKDQANPPPSYDSVMDQMDALKRATRQETPHVAPTGDAARAAIDFASASAVGCLLGFGIDYWLNSSPWGLLIGLFAGFATGVKLMFEAEKRDAKKRAALAKE